MTTIIDQMRYLIIEMDESVCDPDRDLEAFDEARDDLNRMLHALPGDDPMGPIITDLLALATDIRTDVLT